MEHLQSWLSTFSKKSSVMSRDPETIISLNNVHKTYLLGVEGVPALRGISLDIKKGEWVVIYGTSGGGKTSLLNIVGTIDKPTKGELEICGVKINDRTPDQILSRLRLEKLGFVFQSFNLLGSMTARENVELPMKLKAHLSPSERKLRATESLSKVGLSHRVNQYPGKLSGGECQRVTIARSLANRPEVLLLDEPTGDLDTANTHRVLDLLQKLNQQEKVTFVMVTHDVYLKNFAHRVIYMRDGKIAREERISHEKRQAALAQLRDEIIELNAKALGGSKTISTSSTTLDVTEIRQPQDYATYSSKTGIPPTVSPAQKKSGAPQTFKGSSSNIINSNIFSPDGTYAVYPPTVQPNTLDTIVTISAN